MPERPVINLIDNPIAVGQSDPARSAVTPAPQSHEERKAPRQRQPRSTTALVGELTESEINPYAGMRKMQAPVRLFPPLWDHLEQLVRELRAEGLEVDKTSLLNAVLHFHGPADAAAGRELVNRWRALLARPPAARQ